MEITEVKIYPVTDGRLRAYASIVFDNCFIVRELKLVEGDNGFFVSMPSRRRRDGTFKDIAHPLNGEMRSLIEKKVLKAFKEFDPSQAKKRHEDGDNEGEDDHIVF